MYAVIHLPQFALQAVLRHEPERWSEPIALVDPARTTPVVYALTDSARDAGIVPGLTSTQAFARCEIVQIRHRSPARETETTEILLQSATHFSPNLENTGPGICTLDLRGLLTVNIQEPDQREIWIQRLIAALRTLELRAHIGIGSTPNLARYAAEWTATWHFIEQPESFIRSLPIAALNPSSDVTGILRKWGLQTVGELLDLGQAAVADRLGLEALALFAAASTTARHSSPVTGAVTIRSTPRTG